DRDQLENFQKMFSILSMTIPPALDKIRSWRASVSKLMISSDVIRAKNQLNDTLGTVLTSIERLSRLCEETLRMIDEKLNGGVRSATIVGEILKKIDVLNRQGVIAEPTHFKDIADEQTIRQHLSNLINARIIDGGFGSIIRLTQAGSTAFGVLQREER